MIFLPLVWVTAPNDNKLSSNCIHNMIMLCKFENAPCLPAYFAGCITQQEHKWFKAQMLSNLRCRSSLQWSNYCLWGSYYHHHALNSVKSKQAFNVMYLSNLTQTPENICSFTFYVSSFHYLWLLTFQREPMKYFTCFILGMERGSNCY